jgi:hypothetical protein
MQFEINKKYKHESGIVATVKAITEKNVYLEDETGLHAYCVPKRNPKYPEAWTEVDEVLEAAVGDREYYRGGRRCAVSEEYGIKFKDQAEAIDALCRKVFGARPVYYDAAPAPSATPSKVLLSDRVRPDSEAAPWVCDAIKKLERELERELAQATEALETERMRLAAVGVVATADTRETRDRARDMLPEYRSGSLSDVERRVDECIDLREKCDALIAACQWAQVELGKHTRPSPIDTALAMVERREA